MSERDKLGLKAYTRELLEKDYGDSVQHDLGILDEVIGVFEEHKRTLRKQQRAWLEKLLEVARIEVGRKWLHALEEKQRQRMREVTSPAKRVMVDHDHAKDRAAFEREVRRRIDALDRDGTRYDA